MAGSGKTTTPTGWRSLALSIGYVVLFFALLSFALLMLSNYVRDNSSFRLSRMASGNIHVDALVAGGSRGVNLMTGRDAAHPPSVFNISYNAQQYPSTLALIKAFFRRGNTAKMVLIDAAVFYTHDSNCEDKVYWSAYRDLYDAQRADCASDATAARFFPLTAFGSEIFLRDLYYLVKRGGDQDWANETTLSPALCSRLSAKAAGTDAARAASMDVARNRRDIAALKQWLASNGYKTKLVFVLAPTLMRQQALPAIRSSEARAKALFAGEDFVDLAQTIGDHCQWYADEVHLSPEGRKVLLPRILKIIQARLAP
ncbi:MAG TPA: hypothetical protein VG387_16405 [Rhizomicrobium sp.]|jgi:hypothetical protein|nr:hypothetical protein [Rhizomicrobium sp.]